MSVMITRSIFCDRSVAQGCHGWFGERTDATADMLRKDARRYGWKRRNGKDVCPECDKEAT